MDRESVNEIVNTLCSHMEKLETKTEALMQFMKEKKKVTDAQLAPYLKTAANASEVRWRAAKVRIEYLLSVVEKREESEKKQEVAGHEGDNQEPSTPSGMEKAVASEPEPKQVSKDQASADHAGKNKDKDKATATDTANAKDTAKDTAKPKTANVEATQEADQQPTQPESTTERTQPEEKVASGTEDKNTVTSADQHQTSAPKSQPDKTTEDQEAA